MSVVLRPTVTPPLAAAPMLAALRSHTVAGLERHDADTGTHVRSVRGRYGPTVVAIRPGSEHVSVRIDADRRDLPEVEQTVRRWLDLDADPAVIDAALGADPYLAPMVAARPGLRVLGTTDWFDTAVQTVLGQQVSVAAAATFAGRLVARYGDPGRDGLLCFPLPTGLVGADPHELQAAVGLTGARVRTVLALARAAADGLDPSDPVRFRRDLLGLPGIGPWTVDYLAVRVLGDRDACPVGDLVLRRALGVDTAREVTVRTRRWSPWRAYASFHLWTHAAYDSSAP
ncbi:MULTISPECIES: DNA-3-methyladenine glycosylase family protein [Rhodococcus]|uniref:DNA-3-methyladenine glycosylase family protein n=1 Tax=Rhodococcus TaxID=1827 RepID=UPI000299F0BA|nr:MULTISPECIES: AlkA N-terminal domain-containing protein [Rhodococcus]MDO2378083.1 AlkA N-terminal domain-containing protein [Rhodococcus ruber]RIK07686.1 MAG: DNA-3-methyladenine glycosylase 2 family protein [Acidobacteriota bacterium]ATQ29627.1 3-methyladenine DNA glycosylase 2 [Rhodococcus ruber]AUM18651.1 DNA-3-methyladenine glycosylase 2 family protein [Rhodococcus ruber]AWH01032.1 DNA-3-methyladenine glycosylase 2 family protein [Rhodococcus ruber]